MADIRDIRRLSFALLLHNTVVQSEGINISSEMVSKSAHVYDQVNKYTAKYFTDHGWTN